MEKELQPDRQIAPLFDWNEIKDNKNLPYPYIVSFTSRTDNDYMWKKYAKTDGVVMAIDDKLVDMLHEEYANIGYGLLGGPQKNMAFRLLKGYPQFFVKLIAIGLLSLAAPREGLLDGRRNSCYHPNTCFRLSISYQRVWR